MSQKFVQNNKDIENYLDKELASLKESLANERKKLDMVLEGKNKQYVIEIESRILNKVNTILEESSKMKSELIGQIHRQSTETEKL